MRRFLPMLRVLSLCLLTSQCSFDLTAQDKPASKLALPATDDGLAGTGPIRRYDWFQNHWVSRREKFAADAADKKNAVVFFGDSITEGWGARPDQQFPGVKIANRGISGDTTRGMLLRLKDDVLSLDPAAVVMLMGTNDLEEQATAGEIAGNVKLIVAALKAHNAQLPIVLCNVMRVRRPRSGLRIKFKRLTNKSSKSSKAIRRSRCRYLDVVRRRRR